MIEEEVKQDKSFGGKKMSKKLIESQNKKYLVEQKEKMLNFTIKYTAASPAQAISPRILSQAASPTRILSPLKRSAVSQSKARARARMAEDGTQNLLNDSKLGSERSS